MTGFQLTPAFCGFDDEIAAFVAKGISHSDEAEFNRLMLRGFALQYAVSPAYRSYCASLGLSPDTVSTWSEIPAVTSFSHLERLRRFYPVVDADRISLESRAVDLDHRRGPFFPDESLVKLMASVQISAVRTCLFPDVARMKMLFFVPQPRMAPGMVMASGLERFRQEFGLPGSRFLISFTGLDLKGFVADLRKAEDSGEPLSILGATHGLDYFLDACLLEGLSFRLPQGSRLLESGGFMGRHVACPPDAFRDKCLRVLGIGHDFCINALWICESSTVYFDNVLYKPAQRGTAARCKVPPPWTRVEIVHPLTFQRVGEGEIGLIRLYDLSNRGTAFVVQTDKMGCRTADGFDVVGKLDKADPTGGIDRHPPHPGGRAVSRVMEFIMRKKMARIGTMVETIRR